LCIVRECHYSGFRGPNAGGPGRLWQVLVKRDLALPKHQSYPVRSVREFLLFAQGHAGYTFEQTLDMFPAEIGKRGDAKPWQIQQAADAARIYRYPYLGASEDG